MENYADIQPQVKLEIDNALKAYTEDKRFTVANVPAHSHTGVESLKVLFSNLEGRKRFIVIRIVEATTNTAIANVVGGDFTMPFGGYITDIFACVDTAGTTNTTTIDVNKNGSTILLTKITIDSTEKTSTTGATPYQMDSTKYNFIIGDILTFDVDAISTTPAKGLTIYLNVIETTP